MRTVAPIPAICGLAVSALGGTLVLASEVTVPGRPIAPVPTSAGTGLHGFVYLGQDVSSNAAADTIVRRQIPVADFRAFSIDFGNDPPGGQQLGAFLGLDLAVPHAAYLPGKVRSTDVYPSIIRLTGFIKIVKLVTKFALASDDGSRLSIGGVPIIDNDGAHANNFGPGVTTARFSSPGLYPIEILYFETADQGAQLGLFSDASGVAASCVLCGIGAPETMSIVPTTMLYPEDSAWSKFISWLGNSAQPSKLSLTADRASASVGQSISYRVGIENRSGSPLIAEIDYKVTLDSDGGEFQPGNVVTIPKGSGAANVALVIRKVGDFVVRALTNDRQNLLPGQLQSIGCATTGEIHSMFLDPISASRGYVGEALAFRLKFVDEHNAPTAAKTDTAFRLEPKGVGQVVGYDPMTKKRDERFTATVNKDECARIEQAFSSEAGTLTVNATLDTANVTRRQDFTFMLPLTWKLLLLVALGSLGGSFVRIQKRRPRTRRAFYTFYGVGLVAATTAYLFYYYFISLKDVRIGGGYGAAFLLGLIGGYLGPVALDRAGAWLIPPPKAAAQK